MHISNVAGIKWRKVEARKIIHVTEHTSHVGDVFRIETGEIQTGEAGVSEHPLHIDN